MLPTRTGRVCAALQPQLARALLPEQAPIPCIAPYHLHASIPVWRIMLRPLAPAIAALVACSQNPSERGSKNSTLEAGARADAVDRVGLEVARQRGVDARMDVPRGCWC